MFLRLSFDDLRVNSCHSVDGMASHNAQVCHVDPLLVAFLDQGHATQAIEISRPLLLYFLHRIKMNEHVTIVPLLILH